MKKWELTKNLFIFIDGPKENELFVIDFLPTLSYTKFFDEHSFSFSWLFWEIGISYEKSW